MLPFYGPEWCFPQRSVYLLLLDFSSLDYSGRSYRYLSIRVCFDTETIELFQRRKDHNATCQVTLQSHPTQVTAE